MMKFLSTVILVLLTFHISFSQNPTIQVLDTDFSKGRLIQQQDITLNDVAKFHGHLCDGLAVGFLGLKESLYRLYTDSIVDRTNTRVVSKSSPCLCDIGMYLTGGRYQFNTFYVSDSIHYLFVVQRIDNQVAYGVKLKPGVKPTAIDSLGNLANTGALDACGIDILHTLENRFTHQLLTSTPADLFIVEKIQHWVWKPELHKTFIKTDVLNKQKPPCDE